MTPAVCDREARGWSRIRPSGFSELIGPILCTGPVEKRRYGVRVDYKHDNSLARAHGGLIMAFTDEALGLAACQAQHGRMVVTIQFDCQFVAGAKIGDFLEVEPEVVRNSRTLVFMRGSCLSEDQVIAVCSGVWKVVTYHPG